MPERLSRRRTPAITRRKTRPPTHCPLSRHRTSTSHRSKLPKPIKILPRCSSEPILWTVRLIESDDPQPELPLYRPQTCMDIFKPAFHSLPPSPYSYEKYSSDSKVVLKVTVEGSPGPVRTMARLDASVEETIKQVVAKYKDEGRTPRLDRDAETSFELHHSYFSLQSLNQTDRIGDTGSRSFFLRKSSSGNGATNAGDDFKSSPPKMVVPPPLFSSFIARRISKIGRRTKKIWKVLGCMVCE